MKNHVKCSFYNTILQWEQWKTIYSLANSLEPHLVMLRVYSWLGAQKIIYTEIGRLYLVLWIEPKSPMCKDSALPTVLSFSPMFLSSNFLLTSSSYLRKGRFLTKHSWASIFQYGEMKESMYFSIFLTFSRVRQLTTRILYNYLCFSGWGITKCGRYEASENCPYLKFILYSIQRIVDKTGQALL